ncbi:LLM class oxidoreductase [Psychrobacillus sp. NPDC093180]|uniref:LLM class oxidoreductase n=1 Tax=Psychrobacillus sp. NPDC093180 TaxID=3364489 RepID=UPI003824E41D
MNKFEKHKGYIRTFQENKLTLGLAVPLEAYQGNVPEMDLEQQIKLAKLAEDADFASLMVRDIPLNDPSFGDVGQMYDPWIYLSHIAAHTKKIALGTASVITSFQHPLNLAQSAASLDKISGERLLFGLATGDRPIEFDAYNVEREKRAAYYREAFYVMKEVWAKSFPTIQTSRVSLTGGTDLLPKPVLGDIPVFVTGFSGQSMEWIAENSDGLFGYPRNPAQQDRLIKEYRSSADGFKPFAQSLHIDLSEDPNEGPRPIHLGFRSGHKFLIEFLKALQEAGVNHVYLNNKYSHRPAEEVIQELAQEVVPHFPAIT